MSSQGDPGEFSSDGLPRRLREAREALGLSQEDVAKVLGITRPAISAMESGKRRVTAAELKELSALYRRDYSFLLDGSKPQNSLDNAIFRTATMLSDSDKEQVLKFAEYLRTATGPPSPKEKR